MTTTEPTQLSVFFRALQRSLMNQGIICLFERNKWDNKYQRIICVVLASILNLLTLFAIDGSMVYVLVIDPFSGKTKLFIRILLISGLCAVNIGTILTAMGGVWSEYDYRQQQEASREAARKQADDERKLADDERKLAERRHLEIISAISGKSGITSAEIDRLVHEFRSNLFEENKQVIMESIYSAMSGLDASMRYNVMDHATARELKQRTLSYE